MSEGSCGCVFFFFFSNIVVEFFSLCLLRREVERRGRRASRGHRPCNELRHVDSRFSALFILAAARSKTQMGKPYRLRSLDPKKRRFEVSIESGRRPFCSPICCRSSRTHALAAASDLLFLSLSSRPHLRPDCRAAHQRGQREGDEELPAEHGGRQRGREREKERKEDNVSKRVVTLLPERASVARAEGSSTLFFSSCRPTFPSE